MSKYFMQPPFPTKKFFVVLLFLVLVGGITFKVFSFLNNRSEKKALDEQKFAILQNEILPRTINIAGTPTEETRVATSTINAVAAVIYLKEQTKANGATMEEIAASVAKKIQDAKDKLDGDTYTKNGISLSNENSVEAVKKYGNDMAGIFIKQGLVKSEFSDGYLAIIKNALEKNDPKELEKLDYFIVFYKNIIKDSLSVKAPSEATSVHLGLINSYAEMLGVLEGFRGALDTPTDTIASESRLVKSAERFLQAIVNMDEFLKQKGVVFLPGENGILFESILIAPIKQ